jgi:hypothetical protein
MTYRIAFGEETESLEDPDQLVLVSMSDDVADMDNDELIEYIRENPVDKQRLVGAEDAVVAFRRLMADEGVPDSVADGFASMLADALR